MREERLTVTTAGVRLDRFLAQNLEGYTRTFCKSLVLSGKVTVDGRSRPPDYRLRGGEIVRVRVGDPGWETVPFEDWVLFEDDELLVFSKPSGVITHPVGESWVRHPESAQDADEPSVAGLLWKLRPAIRKSGVERCGIVHRLDRQTSGVMIAAKRKPAQIALLKGFRDRTIVKVYRAIVLGRPAKTKVDAPIGRIPGRRRVQVTPWGKEARTDFKTVESARGMSVVQAEPKTGRTHQIRAHLALLGHPVVGDHEWFKEPEQEELCRLGHAAPPRMMLHAYRIRFVHPTKDRKVSHTASLPKDFRAYWKELKG